MYWMSRYVPSAVSVAYAQLAQRQHRSHRRVPTLRPPMVDASAAGSWSVRARVNHRRRCVAFEVDSGHCDDRNEASMMEIGSVSG